MSVVPNSRPHAGGWGMVCKPGGATTWETTGCEGATATTASINVDRYNELKKKKRESVDWLLQQGRTDDASYFRLVPISSDCIKLRLIVADIPWGSAFVPQRAWQTQTFRSRTFWMRLVKV